MSSLGIFFKFNYLSFFVGTFIVFFSLLVLFYSLGAMRGGKGLVRYYFYLLLAALVALGAVFSNHLIVFLVFWGFMGLLLYLLIGFGQKERTPQTAKKAFIIVVGADAFMMVGIAIVWKLTGSLRMDMVPHCFDFSACGRGVSLFCRGGFCQSRRHAVSYLDP